LNFHAKCRRYAQTSFSIDRVIMLASEH
jgi:hypothetical protein